MVVQLIFIEGWAGKGDSKSWQKHDQESIVLQKQNKTEPTNKWKGAQIKPLLKEKNYCEAIWNWTIWTVSGPDLHSPVSFSEKTRLKLA